MRSGLNNTLQNYVTASAANIQTGYAAFMDFASGAQRVWTGLKDITLTDSSGSNTYSAIGNLGSIGAINETTEIAAKNFEVTLSGVDSNNISYALQENYRGRPITIFQVFFNEDYSAQEQITLFSGFMDTMTITEGDDTSTVTVNCENRLITLGRAQEVRYTDEAQRVLYPDDKGLEYLNSMIDKSIYWGSATPSNSPATTTYDPGAYNGIKGGVRL